MQPEDDMTEDEETATLRRLSQALRDTLDDGTPEAIEHAARALADGLGYVLRRE